MKLVWTLFALVSCLEDAARVELRLLNPAPTALACSLAVPPSVAGQAPPGARELGRWGSTLTVSAYGFADVTDPGNERAPTGPPAGLRGRRGAAVTRHMARDHEPRHGPASSVNDCGNRNGQPAVLAPQQGLTRFRSFSPRCHLAVTGPRRKARILGDQR